MGNKLLLGLKPVDAEGIRKSAKKYNKQVITHIKTLLRDEGKLNGML